MPSGHVLTHADWQRVEQTCVEHDLFLLYDAAMEAILFDGTRAVGVQYKPARGTPVTVPTATTPTTPTANQKAPVILR